MNEEVNQKIIQLKEEIQLLNSKLKSLNTEKEAKYKEKESLDENLSSSIKTAKQLKEQKQELTDKIRELKKLREIKNNNVKNKLKELQDLKKERKEQLRKKNIPSINDIRENIKQIEFVIQTQAVSFDREKKYMDQIRKLKAKEKEVAEIERGFKDIIEFKKKIDDEKREADELHRKVQDMAKTNSQIFDELTKKSKEILEIKEQRSTTMALLRTFKLNMNVLNKKLNAILTQWSEVTHESVGVVARKSATLLQKKTAEVKEKFKKKKRLTTEDILILQREAMRK